MLRKDIETTAVRVRGSRFDIELQFGGLYKRLFDDAFFRHDFSSSDLGLEVPCALGASGRILQYETSEVQIPLAESTLRRLVLGRLSLDEVSRLRNQYGGFYEISDYVYPEAKK